MKFSNIVLLITLSASTSALADSTLNKNGFHSKAAKGWFFYEDPTEKIEDKSEKENIKSIPDEKSSSNNKENTIRIDVQWLRENYQVVMDEAQNNPTEENLAKYAYVQRLMVDMSTRFAMKMSNYMGRDELLDENDRRPTSSIQLNAFKNEVGIFKKEAIDKINEVAHIWFFYKSTCEYCHKQIPILRKFQKRHGTEILAISMDGIQLPGMDSFKHVIDAGLRVSTEMQIERTPTLILMTNDGLSHTKVTVGLETLPKLEAKILEIAKATNIITDDEFNKTQEVYDNNSLNQVNGVLVADKDKMEDDPKYFIELMKKQLEINSRKFGSTER